MTSLPTTEALIRSPLGEVRAWVDETGAVRTEVRLLLSKDAGDDGRVMAETGRAALSAVQSLGAMLNTAYAPVADGPNLFQRWFAERCVIDRNAITPSMTLYADFRDFADAQGSGAVMSLRAFGDALLDHQILSRKNGDGRKVRVGIRLRPAAEPLAGQARSGA